MGQAAGVPVVVLSVAGAGCDKVGGKEENDPLPMASRANPRREDSELV